MENITISMFKSSCLKSLEKVKNTGKPLLITKKGAPMALVSPPPCAKKKKTLFGAMKGTIEICGDIVSPLPEEDWEALKK